ncbi:response regulator [Paenibacillus sp. J5C_2022]|uniref:response regulator transcription factor n=1 Tax=Paenibacillus sp. J5C2022 TaxID=2977129 RepID=UPI0021D0E4BA|nr:response regulator [Paenibacillus sp. J5C2022]MCU6708931.1 response regulator [Paenibacillus sp. J5C2022]
MYRLLIVDDEPIIVNGLVDFFTQQDNWPLEVYGANSAEEALQLLLQMRLDIVITDIGMPDMDGLQLQKKIVEQWPRCKLIFLTGYNDFNFVQEALRYNGVDYVLKAEGDDAIVKAVERAIAYSQEEIQREQLLLQADKQLRLALPALQKELLRNIARGDHNGGVHRLEEQFRELSVPLDVEREVFLVLARIDSYKSDYSVYDRGLLAYAIQNVVSEYLQSFVRVVSVEMEQPARMLWFLQPIARNSGEACASFIQGSLESVQQTCRELLDTTISLVIGMKPVSWRDAWQLYDKCNRLLSQGLGMGTELLLTYRDTESERASLPHNPSKIRQLLERLKQQLESGQMESFDSVYFELMQEGSRYSDESGIRQEIYYSLVPSFIACMNRNMLGDQAAEVDIIKLTRMDSHSSWDAVTAYFYDLATAVFSSSKACMQLEEHDVVRRVHQYIHDHLDGDVSLVRIGDVVGHNSKYLSRLYKKITGEDLSQYIASMKLSRAQTLLQETDMKIYEISAAVGFLSEPYFYRFFRNATGNTPQEYREIQRRAQRQR